MNVNISIRLSKNGSRTSLSFQAVIISNCLVNKASGLINTCKSDNRVAQKLTWVLTDMSNGPNSGPSANTGTIVVPATLVQDKNMDLRLLKIIGNL
jgi:hypothetical protein